MIEKNQKEYYDVLESCDKMGESTQFIEFMLRIILTTLSEFMIPLKTVKLDKTVRLQKALEHFKEEKFSKIEYLSFVKNISSATASRDLNHGVSQKILKSFGYKNQTKYKFILS